MGISIHGRIMHFLCFSFSSRTSTLPSTRIFALFVYILFYRTDWKHSLEYARQASLARGPTATQKLRQVLRPLRIAHNSAGLPYMLDTSSSVFSSTTSTTT